MTLTNNQSVRLKIQDQPLIADDTYHGDGSAITFGLPHRSLTSGSAFVPDGAGWTTTGATFDASGFVTFSDAVSANSAFRVRYVHSTFSDDEIDHFLDAGGSVNGAALEAVQTLMFDGLKRSNWRAPDGTEFDDTAAMSLLRDLHDRLKSDLADNAIGGAAIESWSENQEHF